VSPSSRSFAAAYAETFEAYLDEPDERGLRLAYELGRDAVAKNLTLLDLAVAHHDALAEALRQRPDPGELALTAGEFFIETASAFEMAQRVYREGRAQAAVERRAAVQLRQLSTFLADASLALGASDSFAEMLQLVAEQARDLLDAGFCRIVVTADGRPFEAVSADGGPHPGDNVVSADLTALDGRSLGAIEVGDKADGEFTSVDRAQLVHLAQLAAAAIERRALYAG
jgi:phosphoserine phosphatase RsbU-like protein